MSHYGWFVVRDDTSGEYHIMPTDEAHAFYDCPCQPWENADGNIVHNSNDGREKFETGERKPS